MEAPTEGEGTEWRTALYPRLLGPAWLDLDPAVRRAHVAGGVAIGRFRIRYGTSLVVRIVRWVLRFPSPGEAQDTRLAITRAAGVETWVRTFGRRSVVTTQRGLADGTLAERLGVLELRFELNIVEGGLTYDVVWWVPFALYLYDAGRGSSR